MPSPSTHTAAKARKAEAQKQARVEKAAAKAAASAKAAAATRTSADKSHTKAEALKRILKNQFGKVKVDQLSIEKNGVSMIGEIEDKFEQGERFGAECVEDIMQRYLGTVTPQYAVVTDQDHLALQRAGIGWGGGRAGGWAGARVGPQPGRGQISRAGGRGGAAPRPG